MQNERCRVLLRGGTNFSCPFALLCFPHKIPTWERLVHHHHKPLSSMPINHHHDWHQHHHHHHDHHDGAVVRLGVQVQVQVNHVKGIHTSIFLSVVIMQIIIMVMMTAMTILGSLGMVTMNMNCKCVFLAKCERLGVE